MSNSKPDFFTVIKTIISSITKHPMNICPSSKCNTNQGKVTFELLSFLQSIYNFIKFSNQSILNVNKRRESSNKLPHTPTENTSTSGKTWITPTNINMKRTENFTVLIPKNFLIRNSI